MNANYEGPTVSVPDRNEIIAFVLGIVPFVCNFSTSTTTTRNGQVTSHQETDFIALAAGAIVMLMAAASFRLLGRTANEDRIKRIGIIVVLVALGAFQILRGLGVLTSV